MTDTKPMPRGAIIAAGWIIALAALTSLGLGVIRDLKSANGGGGDAGEVVAPVKAANAQPLTAPPVTEADVRRWAREEMLASLAARAPKKADESDNGPAGGDGPVLPAPIAAPAAPAQPPSGNVTAAKPSPQTAPPIPF